MARETARAAGVAPFLVFTVGVLLVIGALAVLGLPDVWASSLLVGLLVITVVWVGLRTAWRPRAVVGALLLLVALGFMTGFVFSAAFPSMGALVEVREDRVMSQVRGLAADAGFVALVVDDGQSAVDEWPVGELTEPAGFTLAYGPLRWGYGPDLWIAEHRAVGRVSEEDLQSMVSAGQPIAPGWTQVIPEGPAHQDLTVQGGPAVGLQYTDDAGQPASVLVAVIDDVVVRAWLLGDDGVGPLVAAAEALVPLP